MSSSETLKHRMYGPMYRSYMIRLWWEDPNQPPRVLVKSVDGDTAMRFATLDAFFDFLTEQPIPTSSTATRPSNDDNSEPPTREQTCHS